MFLIFFRIDAFHVVWMMKFGWQDATIGVFCGIVIRMYVNDHAPPDQKPENQYSGKVKNERSVVS
jgi:hypothetical protein